MKIGPVRAKLLHANGQTDWHDKTFYSFPNTHTNWHMQLHCWFVHSYIKRSAL